MGEMDQTGRRHTVRPVCINTHWSPGQSLLKTMWVFSLFFFFFPTLFSALLIRISLFFFLFFSFLSFFFFFKPIYKTHYILQVERAPSWLGSHSLFFSEFGKQPILQKPELNSGVSSFLIQIITYASKILQWLSLLLHLRLDKHEDSKLFKI